MPGHAHPVTPAVSRWEEGGAPLLRQSCTAQRLGPCRIRTSLGGGRQLPSGEACLAKHQASGALALE